MGQGSNLRHRAQQARVPGNLRPRTPIACPPRTRRAREGLIFC
jgi:hypothetical protein